MSIPYFVVTVVGLLLMLDGAITHARLSRELAVARDLPPVDEVTGLLSERAFIHRVTSELKRAQRSGASVWLGVWTIVEGDPDRFGRIAADVLRFPEAGFRISDRVFCFIRPLVTRQQRADLVLRLRTAAPRRTSASGEATWTGGSTDAMALLQAAIGSME